MQAIIITDGTVEEIAALILAVQEQHGEIDVQDIARQFQEGLEEAISKNSGEQKTLSSFVKLAQEAEDLGIEDDDIDAILAIYAKHKERNQDPDFTSRDLKLTLDFLKDAKKRDQNI